MDPFKFSALKVDQLVSVKFGPGYRTARIIATFVSDETVAPGSMIVQIVDSGFQFTVYREAVRAYALEER